jgi:hypothetical protein
MSVEKLSPEQRETLKGGIAEAVNCKYLIQAQKDLITDIQKRMKDETAIKSALFNKLVKVAYEDSGKKVNDETTELLDLAEELGLYSHEEG